MGNHATVESLASQIDASESQVETSGQNMQKLQKQAQQAQQERQKHQQAVRQLRQQAAMLESQIEQLREMLASIQDADDDSGSAGDLRSQIQAQISQLQSRKYSVESRMRQEAQQADRITQQLQGMTQQIQMERSRLVQTRRALVEADEQYAGLIGSHSAAQRNFQRIGQHRNKGSSVGAAHSMEQVVQASQRGQTRVAQLQTRIEHYLGDGVIPAAAAAAAVTLGAAGAAAHSRAVSARGTGAGADGMPQGGSMQNMPGSIQTAAPSAQPTEEMNTPVGFLRNLRKSKASASPAAPQPEGPLPGEQKRARFIDSIHVNDSDLQPSQPSLRPQGTGPGTGQRIQQRGGLGRDDDDGPSKLNQGASNKGASNQGTVPWTPPTPPQQPAVIPSNWKRIQGPHSLLDDIAAVNPDYKNGHLSTHENCQRCVIAGEMRRRGYDVVARPAIGKTVYHVNKKGEREMSWQSEEQGGLPYLFAPDGSVNPNGFAAAFKGAKPVPCSADSGMMSARNVMRQMKEWGEGARAIVAVSWAGTARDADGRLYTVDFQDGKCVYRDYETEALLTDQKKIDALELLTDPSGGHVFKAEVINGKVCCYDEQSGRHDMEMLRDHFKLARGRRTMLIRIDDLEPTELVQKCCKPRETIT